MYEYEDNFNSILPRYFVGKKIIAEYYLDF